MNLCLEVTSLLDNLPELTFMRAQVLMFPVHAEASQESAADAAEISISKANESPSSSSYHEEPETSTSVMKNSPQTTTTTNTTRPAAPGVCTISYS